MMKIDYYNHSQYLNKYFRTKDSIVKIQETSESVFRGLEVKDEGVMYFGIMATNGVRCRFTKEISESDAIGYFLDAERKRTNSNYLKFFGWLKKEWNSQ